MTARNEKLFYDVAKRIEEHPDHYDQYTYVTVDKQGAPLHLTHQMHNLGGEALDFLAGHVYVPACNTVACIAGTVAVMEGWHFNWRESQWEKEGQTGQKHPVAIATDALGLTVHEADVLFHEDWEPDEEMTVPEALRFLGDGMELDRVTHEDADL
jgi:hypothetical protein